MLVKTGPGELRFNPYNAMTGGTSSTRAPSRSATKRRWAARQSVRPQWRALHRNAQPQSPRHPVITVTPAGGTLDSVGYNITIAGAVAGSGPAPPKIGSGTLTLLADSPHRRLRPQEER
jgi:hypothetical protein